MNFLVNLSCWITYEVIILSESRNTHFMLLSYPKKPGVMDIDGVVVWVHLPWKFWLDTYHIVSPSIYYDNHGTHRMQMFLCQQTRPVLQWKKTLLLPHLKQVYSQLSKASCDFSSCLIKRFILSLAESKTGCSKIGSIFLLTFWINRRWPKKQTETSFLVDFVFNKKWQKKRKKNNNTRKTSWTRRPRL